MSKAATMASKQLRNRKAIAWIIAALLLAAFIVSGRHNAAVEQRQSEALIRQEIRDNKAEAAQEYREATCIARTVTSGSEMATAVNRCLEAGFNHQSYAISLSECLAESIDPALPAVTATEIDYYWTECADPGPPTSSDTY
jgi:Tfp pilus assembly protein PilX